MSLKRLDGADAVFLLDKAVPDGGDDPRLERVFEHPL